MKKVYNILRMAKNLAFLGLGFFGFATEELLWANKASDKKCDKVVFEIIL